MEKQNNPFASAEENKPKAYEILPNMTVEEMTAMFFDGALVEPPYKVFQLNSKGHRYYYRYGENGEPEFYPSVTTMLSQTMPTPPHLIKWIAEKGYDEAEAYKQERAYYGTFMHAQFEELIINGSYDLDALKEKLLAYMQVNKLPDNFIYYADDIKKDILAFAQFVIDYDVKPLAVEISLVHPLHNYAGMIDLPCTMLTKPNGEIRVNAIVDFKSGRKGFYEEHEIQLHLYKDMWNVNFPDTQIERVYNFSPKDWRKKPTYNLKEQTDSPNAKKIPALLQIAEIEDNKIENVFTATSGIVTLSKETNLTQNIISLTLAELIKTRAKENTPETEEKKTDETTAVVEETGKTIKKRQKRATTNDNNSKCKSVRKSK